MNPLYALFALFVPSVALAHEGHLHGALDGLIHPLTGLDHLLAALCVGLLARGTAARTLWASFVGALALGLLVGAATGGYALEAALSVSVVLAGITAWRAPAGLPLAVVLGVGLVHGHAHGAELAGGGAAFATGLVLASGALAALGAAVAAGAPQTSRALGAAIAVAYGALAFA